MVDGEWWMVDGEWCGTRAHVDNKWQCVWMSMGNCWMADGQVEIKRKSHFLKYFKNAFNGNGLKNV